MPAAPLASGAPTNVTIVVDNALDASADAGAHLDLVDNSPQLAPVTSYFYSAFVVTAAGDFLPPSYRSHDRTIGSVLRGPLPGINVTSDYLLFLSAWTDDHIRHAERYDLVICHPGGGSSLITADQVRDLRDGPDNVLGTEDDTIVIGYVSVCEDYGEPRVGATLNDPRNASLRAGLNSRDGPLAHSYETGAMWLQGQGYPSFYVDMSGTFTDAGGSYFEAVPDGKPDQNSEWGGLYVNPGDPLWFQFLKEATIGTVAMAGFDYILNDLGMDGLFLDTLDALAPQAYYWLRHGGVDLIARIAYTYPDALLIGNRPLHLAMPSFAGSRVDDFRSYINAIYWESWAADTNHWMSPSGAATVVADIVAAQDNQDGRGLTTLILDYWSVVFAARESGEALGAPWYSNPGDYLAETDALGFPTYISPSRSLAEFDDVVYNIHHPEVYGGAPDLVIVSIIPDFTRTVAESGWVSIPASTPVSVVVVNRGAGPPPLADPYSATLSIYHNGELLSSRLIFFSEGFYTSPGGLVTVVVPVSLGSSTIGNHVYATVELEPGVIEYDTTNNHDDVLLESFFNIAYGTTYKHSPPPDLVVSSVVLDPPQPPAGSSFDLLVTYANVGAGIAQASRAFIWSSFAQAQVGNFEAPHLLPSATTTVRATHPPISRVGMYSLAITLDATEAIPEADETNNEFFVHSFEVTPPFTSLALPYPSPITTASAMSWESSPDSSLDSNAPNMVSLSAAHSPVENLIVATITVDGDFPLRQGDVILFINTDESDSTGYLSAGFDRMILNDVFYRHDPAAGRSWGWIVVPTPTNGREWSVGYQDTSGRVVVIAIPPELLYSIASPPVAIYLHATIVANPAAGNGVSDAIPASVLTGGKGLPLRLRHTSSPELYPFVATALIGESVDGESALFLATNVTAGKLYIRLDSVSMARYGAIDVVADVALFLAVAGPTPRMAYFDGSPWRFVGSGSPEAIRPSPPAVRAALGYDPTRTEAMWAPESSAGVSAKTILSSGVVELAFDVSLLAKVGISLEPTVTAPLLVMAALEQDVLGASSASWLPARGPASGLPPWAIIPHCSDGRLGPLEEGVDCGGVCSSNCGVPHCSNGFLDAAEEGVDCGGVCAWTCVPEALGLPDWAARTRSQIQGHYDFDILPGFHPDADVIEVVLAHSDHNVVVRAVPRRAKLDVLANPIPHFGSVKVFLGIKDLDRGYTGLGRPGFSALFVFIDSVLHVYDEENAVTQTDWAWIPVPSTVPASGVKAEPGRPGVDFVIARTLLTTAAALEGLEAKELQVFIRITMSGSDKELPASPTEVLSLTMSQPEPGAGVVVDGIIAEWASLAHTSVTDGPDDALRVIDALPYPHAIGRQNDFAEVKHATDFSTVYGAFSMWSAAKRPVDVETAVFVVPLSAASRGYALGGSDYAIAMVLDGKGYLYSGPRRSALWSWSPVTLPSQFGVATLGRHTEFRFSRELWADLSISIAEPFKIVARSTSFQGSPTNFGDDLIDYVPNTGPFAGPAPPGPPSPPSPPPGLPSPPPPPGLSGPIMVDGLEADWLALPPTLSPLLVSDSRNDGRTSNNLYATDIDPASGDYAALKSLTYESATSALVSTYGTPAPGGSSRLHHSIFFAVSAPSVPSGGYELKPGVYAVAMIADGLGYVYSGSGLARDWVWARVSEETFAAAAAGANIEVTMKHSAFAGLTPPSTPIAVYAQVRNDRGTLGTTDDDVSDYVPEISAAVPPLAPPESPWTGPPRLALGIDGNGAEWPALVASSHAADLAVRIIPDAANDPGHAVSTRAQLPDLAPANDLREVITAADADVVAVYAVTYASIGTPPTPGARYQVFFVTDAPRAGYLLDTGRVAVAYLENGAGYVYSGSEVSRSWAWTLLPAPSSQYSAVASGNAFEAFMASRFWVHLVDSDAAVTPIVALVSGDSGYADFAPDVRPATESSKTGIAAHIEWLMDPGETWLIRGSLLLALLICCCCSLLVLCMWRRQRKLAKASAAPLAADSASDRAPTDDAAASMSADRQMGKGNDGGGDWSEHGHVSASTSAGQIVLTSISPPGIIVPMPVTTARRSSASDSNASDLSSNSIHGATSQPRDEARLLPLVRSSESDSGSHSDHSRSGETSTATSSALDEPAYYEEAAHAYEQAGYPPLPPEVALASNPYQSWEPRDLPPPSSSGGHLSPPSPQNMLRFQSTLLDNSARMQLKQSFPRSLSARLGPGSRPPRRVPRDRVRKSGGDNMQRTLAALRKKKLAAMARSRTLLTEDITFGLEALGPAPLLAMASGLLLRHQSSQLHDESDSSYTSEYDPDHSLSPPPFPQGRLPHKSLARELSKPFSRRRSRADWASHVLAAAVAQNLNPGLAENDNDSASDIVVARRRPDVDPDPILDRHRSSSVDRFRRRRNMQRE
ncbi:uncharacterized protein AMSG_11605 [Thecamonas trahens ATCC 50062]|uniref:CARDB domain-containing protein n=1 Tax=Thecamonas trahens ATCC 50062 TaxID=461836 RepID=A0A0L0D9H5_THETB|nr:hypothetical protein AMSG_11605 [Thecamonas trahens ATCC 50062]KNC48711.1 hypothetical protein AMSG_11605 [Thecamonas trahens ATCC 50062]|eukprot:XP_013762876.1 hypothetical protein AMSG_11605 [Thecamonas trahens ATCC 50062]